MPIANNSRSPARVQRRSPSVPRGMALAALVLTVLSDGIALHAAEPRAVFAQGSRELFWVALAQKGTAGNPPEQVQLLHRRMADKGDWFAGLPMPARVLAMSSQGHDLGAESILLLETFKPADVPAGQKAPDVVAERVWAWYSGPVFDKNELRSDGRFSYGPVLPNKAKPLAVAGEAGSRVIWGIGRSTPPVVTSAPTTSTTQRAVPTSMPAGHGVGLYSLEGEQWKTHSISWPAEFDNNADLVELAVARGRPMIALEARDQIRIYDLPRDANGWRLVHAAQVEPKARRFKLLAVSDGPALWIQPEPTEGLGTIWTPDVTFKLGLKEGGALPNPKDVDVAHAGHEFRVVFRREQGGTAKMYEKPFSKDGGEGDLKEIAWTTASAQPPIHWVTTIIMTIFTVLIISTVLRRRAAEREGDGRERERDRDDE